MKKLILPILLIYATVAMAQSENKKILIEDFAWLVGYWVGDGLGGVSEEIWAPAQGNVMMGMYRHSKDSAVNFYEFMHLSAEGLTLKHFDPDMTGWEEKDKTMTFPLLEIQGDRFIFEGLEIWHKAPDEMEVKLILIQNRETKTEIFRYKRQPL